MVKQPVILVAASGLAREVLSAIQAAESHEVVGVLDDDTTRLHEDVGGAKILGSIDDVGSFPSFDLVLCAGRGAARERIAARLAALGVPDGRYLVVRHPSVDIPPSCEIGFGTILLAHAALTADVRIGRHAVVMPSVTLTHDDVLEDFVTIAAGVSLGGGVRVEERAYLGMNSTVRERITVGRGAALGMGAALLQNLPAGETWIGVPAGPMRPDGFGTIDGPGAPSL